MINSNNFSELTNLIQIKYNKYLVNKELIDNNQKNINHDNVDENPYNYYTICTIL